MITLRIVINTNTHGSPYLLLPRVAAKNPTQDEISLFRDFGAALERDGNSLQRLIRLSSQELERLGVKNADEEFVCGGVPIRADEPQSTTAQP
jgi:hypothetical protein